MSERNEAWWERFKEQGHEPIIDEDGEPNIFVFSSGHHNGPGCKKCGWNTCWHCEGPEKIPKCNQELS